ncbi:MAG TPA: hypothetical protein VNY05_41120 [Candidatus Acidoferrales bacterium]|nr:hypothetical protein [Candidatus Acidoferrales bacterium]
MLQEFAPAGGGPPYLNGLNEARVIFKHTFNGFLYELGGCLAGTYGGVPKPGFCAR